MQTTTIPKGGRVPLRFFWTTREKDGAEIFCCRHADGSVTEVLAPEEIETAEELIAELAR